MSNTIKEVYTNERKDGGTYWSVILDDGERYSIFDTKIGENLAPGQTYDFGVVTKGQFKNIVSATPVEDVNADIQGTEPEPEFVTEVPPEHADGMKTSPSMEISQTAPEEKPIEHTSPASKTKTEVQNKPITKDEAIARSVALKCATTYLQELPGGYTPSELGAVVSMAQRFFTYLTTGN